MSVDSLSSEFSKHFGAVMAADIEQRIRLRLKPRPRLLPVCGCGIALFVAWYVWST